MKRLIIKIIFLSSIVLSTVFAGSGEGAGNGGSGREVQLASQQSELELITQKIKLFFQNNKNELSIKFPEFKPTDLVNIINSVRIEVTKNKLKDKDDVPRTCLNFPESSLIECNSSELQKIKKDPKVLFVLMLHEVLGLLGVEETSPKNPSFIDGYKYSKKLAPYVSKIADYDLRLPVFVKKEKVETAEISAITKKFPNEKIVEVTKLRQLGHDKKYLIAGSRKRWGNYAIGRLICDRLGYKLSEKHDVITKHNVFKRPRHLFSSMKSLETRYIKKVFCTY